MRTDAGLAVRKERGGKREQDGPGAGGKSGERPAERGSVENEWRLETGEWRNG